MMTSKYCSFFEVTCKCNCGGVPTAEMLAKFDEIREKFGKPINISSGYRCEKQNKKIGGSPKSNHVTGKAIDVVRTSELEKFILANLETLDIYIEDLASTPTWIHIQITPPKSGKRTFKP
jgi:hypothetical protein